MVASTEQPWRLQNAGVGRIPYAKVRTELIRDRAHLAILICASKDLIASHDDATAMRCRLLVSPSFYFAGDA